MSESGLDQSLPTISVVTPCFNAVRTIERTIESVLDQGYPNLEYIIMDGGSTDGTVDVIRRYGHALTYWTSERDGGQYDAVNRGFAHSSGQVMAYLNADDLYMPWTLSTVGEVFAGDPSTDWLTTAYPLIADHRDRICRCYELKQINRSSFMRGDFIPDLHIQSQAPLQQESTFWTRRLWDRAGGCMDLSVTVAADFELWARFFQHAELRVIDAPLAAFRRHDAGQRGVAEFELYRRQVLEVFARYGGRPRRGWWWSLVNADRWSVGWRRWLGRLGLIGWQRRVSYDFEKQCWYYFDRL